MRTETVTGISRLIAIVSLLLLLAACNGGKGADSASDTKGEGSSNLSGAWKVHQEPVTKAVCDGPLADYTVTMLQNGGSITVIDPDGNQFSGTVNGDTVSWSGSYPKEGGTMTITSMVLSVSEGSRTLSGTSSWLWTGGDGASCSGAANVTATKVSDAHTISGTVSAGGQALKGVTVTLSGAGSGAAATNESGGYTFTVIADGSYILTPSQSGFTFTPASQAVTMAGANVPRVDFQAAADIGTGYSIYGKIAGIDGTPLPGVTVTVSEGAGQALTDETGAYGIGGLADGTYTVTPLLAGCLFNPASRQVTIRSAHAPADFISYHAVGDVRYDIIDLGLPAGYSSSYATEINNQGQVVGQLEGYATSSGAVRYERSHAFFYREGIMTDLGTLAGAGDDYPNYQDSYAFGINDAGVIVGYSNGDYTSPQAFSCSLAGPLASLDFLGSANSINNSGLIVGYRGEGDEYHEGTQAFLLDNGAFTDLGTLPGYACSSAQDINAGGLIVGCCGNGSLTVPMRAFLYSGVMTDLGVLPGDITSIAYRINDRGEVIGASSPSLVSVFGCHAFLYSGGEMKDMGTLYPRDVGCSAYGINGSGQVVGTSSGADAATGQGVQHAFLYTDGVMTDLDSLIDFGLGWNLESATDINDQGQIVGYGIVANGERHAFLMTPVAR